MSEEDRKCEECGVEVRRYLFKHKKPIQKVDLEHLGIGKGKGEGTMTEEMLLCYPCFIDRGRLDYGIQLAKERIQAVKARYGTLD